MDEYVVMTLDRDNNKQWVICNKAAAKSRIKLALNDGCKPDCIHVFKVAERVVWNIDF